MSGDEDKLPPLDEQPMVDDYEQGSHERAKQPAPPSMRLLLTEFADRSRGLTGAELDRELDRFIDRIVERNVGLAPAGLRDELREVVRSFLENDPTLSALVRDLKTASR